MLASELIQYLTNSGFNVYPDANFIPGEIPDSKLPCLFVFGTGGFKANADYAIEKPTFQVIVKGKDYKNDFTQMDSTEQLAKSVIDLLHRKSNYILGNNHVYFSEAVQSNPIPIGLDEQSRPTYSTNFIFKVKEAL